jgi:protection of telomeres protein 1
MAARSSFGALSKKFRLIKDVSDGMFADLLVRIVKKFVNSSDSAELYVTDYTENRDLFYRPHPSEDPKRELLGRDGDAYAYITSTSREWEGPYGYFALNVKLWQPHAAAADREFQEGDIAFLTNVKIKYSPSSKLEGSIHSDWKYPDKVCIIKPDGRAMSAISDLNQRQQEYENQIAKKERKAQSIDRKQAKAKKNPATITKDAEISRSESPSSVQSTPQEEPSAVTRVNPHGRPQVFFSKVTAS